MSAPSPTQPARLVLCHKQATSARVRFFSREDSILAFDPLGAGASLHDEDYMAEVPLHPGAVVRAAEARLALPGGSLAAEGGFQAWIATDAGEVPVVLAAFQSADPPFDAAERCGGRFIAMTDARRLPPLEQQLLRRVYEYLLG
jgi:hypothetical protein